MPAPSTTHSNYGVALFGIGTDALRKAIARPLKRSKQSAPQPQVAFNSCASDDAMSAVLEGDIIPRLMMAHMIDGAIHSKQDRGQINPDESEDFASMAVRLEAPDLLKAVDRFLGQGGSVESAFVDLLAPAARHLGEMWEQDECDFVDVTMGLWRLQEVMREISLRSPPEPAPLRGLRSAVFCPVPGDTHSFGAQMIEEVFARAGWQSEVLVSPERRELLDHVARSPVDLVGLTVSSKTSVSALSSLVKSIKGVSLNPHTCVLVGGSVINQNPELVTEIGADGTGRDANSALETAERLVAAAPVRAQSFV